ncbi:GPI ethanolamine phosphate transferase 3 isoform X1 [Octopus bimaculoides]|uniref:GPI ethanolamine phosphate transferase 2 C-terminal domain-containing protein n=1 Tax=Octopus bimaculoides TaxID=37653 RepID=A0A0L8GE68_OCTBM|nr:GPI ethanolamine phosphate transferase 3 isoform X1 [Octopus bimaculoides]|eukprot:XP_014781790.1 PREDICTED: GPI ethanolamine phosphate transferase 3-like [Octopus bimaculoides]
MILGMCRLFCLLLVLTFLYALAVYIFAQGFLLKRTVLPEKSQCNVNFATVLERHGEQGCWMHGRFRRAIIIIIDGLRYDFLVPNNTAKTNMLPYINKLTVVHDKYNQEKDRAMLYKFIADPPTTTMQRLTGLTTGSLPTFIEAGSNFRSTEITEDNIIDQLVAQKKKIKFLGDDTWMGLFPGRFTKSFAFPSFNVKDLHSVDNGIISHLSSELAKSDWHVSIAHFLGVDHCGHRFGPNHTAMAEKLSQMNEMLDSVMKLMKDDTILFLFGDHGMTDTGDHGGDSKDEIESGLFIYSPSRLRYPPSKTSTSAIPSIAQIDIVPTLSLLLGVPIPFSNVGMVINELFSFCPWWDTYSDAKQLYHNIKALRLNAHQLDQYSQIYSQTSGEPLLKNKFLQLHQKFEKAEKEFSQFVTEMVKSEDMATDSQWLARLKNNYVAFISETKEMCQDSWAKFDTTQILLGFFVMYFAIFVNIYFLKLPFLRDTSYPKSVVFLLAGIFIISILCILQSLYFKDSSVLNIPSIMIIFDVAILAPVIYFVITKSKLPTLSSLKKTFSLRKYDLVTNCSCLTTIIYIAAFFSNSYVVYEDCVVTFLILSHLCCYFVQLLRKMLHDKMAHHRDGPSKRSKSVSKFDIGYIFIHPAFIIFLLVLLFCLVLRFSISFRTCREEQWTCIHSIFTFPLSNLSDSESKNLRYFFSVACIITVIVVSHQWLRFYGNLNSNITTVLFYKYGFPAATICIGLHWAVQGLPAKELDSLPYIHHVFLARLAYALLILSMLSFIINPLCVHLVQTNRKRLNIPSWRASVTEIIPEVFKQLHKNWGEEKEENSEKPVIACGLGTVQTASSIYCVTMCSLLVSLLLGDGMTPSILLALILICIFLELHSTFYHTSVKLENAEVSWTSITMWSLLSICFFYATGHQATIQTIRWESAFVGFYGDFTTHIIPSVLITLNTFAGPILFTVAAPLLLFWPHINKPAAEYFSHKKKAEEWRGDVVLFEKNVVPQLLFMLYTRLFLFSSLALLSSMTAAALHRRHLMVWKIFAPRFIFAAAMSGVTFLTGLITFLLMIRVQAALSRWFYKLAESYGQSQS